LSREGLSLDIEIEPFEGPVSVINGNVIGVLNGGFNCERLEIVKLNLILGIDARSMICFLQFLIENLIVFYFKLPARKGMASFIYCILLPLNFILTILLLFFVILTFSSFLFLKLFFKIFTNYLNHFQVTI
jgi:hypothetical protein